MANPNIRIKRSSVEGKRPSLSQVDLGELAVNTNDGRLFTRKENVGIGSTVTLLNPWTENIGGGVYYIEGNVGIGTTNPLVALDVAGDVRIKKPSGGGGIIFLDENSTGSTEIYLDSYLTNYVQSNTSDGITISSNGKILLQNSNVGIGTTNPLVALDVNGNIKANRIQLKDELATIGGNSANAANAVLQIGDTSGPFIVFDTNEIQQFNTTMNLRGEEGLIFYTGDVADGDGLEIARILKSGNVGIGTTNPQEKLDVNGKVIIQGALGVGGTNYGSAGQVLISNGSSSAPSWEDLTLPATFGWDHDDDTYGLYLLGTSIKTSDITGTIDIDVQSRMRRCVINDSGVVQYYLDADDSDLKSGDWLRIVETETIGIAYTGTISESTNSLLRVGVPAWAAGTFTRGQRVTNGGYLWECIAASTTATPAVGTVASDLTGTDGQVMVEVPAFSVRYGFLNGVHTREVRLGCSDSLIAQGFQPHPAFIKTDGTYKDAFYIGAYHTYDNAGTGSSVSGQTNTRSQTRATFRTEAAARGTGWHVLSYLEYAAIQTLLVCEFRDYNSQKVVGNGSDVGTTYGVTTGQSDSDGNHSVNSTDNVSDADDYMSYRGIENLYGRAWQWVDGVNIYERVVYLTNDQTAFADDTSVGYTFYAQLPNLLPGDFNYYQKDLYPLADVFLPSVNTGGSNITYLGDSIVVNTGWRVGAVGGNSNLNEQCGVFCTTFGAGSGIAAAVAGARLAYAVN